MGLHTLRFTLFGLKNTHDWFAERPGAFDDIIKASIRAREVGIRVQWTIQLHSKNIKELNDVLELSENYTTDKSVHIGISSYLGRAISNDELRPTSKNLEELPSKLLNKIDPDVKTEREWIENALENSFPDEPLKRVFNTILIESNGNIRDITIPYYGFGAPVIGNIFNYQIQDILQTYTS